MRLFINLYLDEDVDILIATLIQRHGLVAITTRDASREGSNDPEQLAFAADRRLAIVTHNRDDYLRLAEQYRSARQYHAGIIIAVRRTPYELAAKLRFLMNDITADEMDNQVYYI